MTIPLVSAEGAPVPATFLDQHEPLALRSELVGATGAEDAK